MPLIQEELNRIAQHWNLHRIRPSLNQESPPGLPDVSFFLPELQETISYLHTIDEDAILVGKDMCWCNPISTSYDICRDCRNGHGKKQSANARNPHGSICSLQ